MVSWGLVLLFGFACFCMDVVLIGYVSCDWHGARVPCSGVIGVEPHASDH